MLRESALIFSLAAAAHAQPAGLENPRDTRFSGPVIEYISITPRPHVREIGDRPRRPDGPEATLTAHLRNPTDRPANTILRWTDRHSETVTLAPRAVTQVRWTIPPDQIPYGTSVHLHAFGPAGDSIADSAPLHPEQAMRTALLVERRTLEAGDERFGSFTRRMRKSFEDLHALFDSTNDTDDPALQRQPIRDRFRIEHIIVYDRDDGTLPIFWDHPEFDLVIDCDEGGPKGGFYLPAYSIGHNFFRPAPARPDGQGEDERTAHGIWSAWGEQALWHEILHFRGVPDYYIYPIPAGALEPWTAETVPVPAPYDIDIMNNPYRDRPVITPLTALVANSKHGVARVGACEEPDHEFGHMWRWIPDELVLHVSRGGEPAPEARVRWWRSLPAGQRDGRIQGVAPGRDPDGSAKADEQGRVHIRGDYMGRAAPRPERSLWLLVEVKLGDETRWTRITGLWLNERWARGGRKTAERTLDWESLTPK